MRYRAVAELSSDFAFSYDVALDGTTRSEWVTDALTHITGYLPHKLDDAGGWMRLIVGEDRERADEWRRNLCAGIAAPARYGSLPERARHAICWRGRGRLKQGWARRCGASTGPSGHHRQATLGTGARAPGRSRSAHPSPQSSPLL